MFRAWPLTCCPLVVTSYRISHSDFGTARTARPTLKTSLATVILALLLCLGGMIPAKADVLADATKLQNRMETTLLDVYEGTTSTSAAPDLQRDWLDLTRQLTDPEAIERSQFTFQADDLAGSIGTGRSLLSHLSALEALRLQSSGKIAEARVWRNLITLPKFANANDGGLLLQLPVDQARKPEVTQALSREYLEWEVARVRQMMDTLQRDVSREELSPLFIRENLAETKSLAQFPNTLFQRAGLTPSASLPEGLPTLAGSGSSGQPVQSLAAWREQVEASLPNLLTADRARRLERLLARLIKLVPKEYRNGVQEGRVLVPLEYQEANQFTQQAQGLVGQLGPVWRQEKRQIYDQYHGELNDSLTELQSRIDHLEEPQKIDEAAGRVGSILEGKLGLNPRQSGAKGQVIEETALEVKSSLASSLAAMQAGHWQEAESLRLDAYTSFDSEIEVRVLPRNPDLAYKSERSFLDGTEKDPGIKALLDRQAPLTEITQGYERTLRNVDECVELLKISVSPTTIGFTAFSIIAREGMEAVIILAALLAGLKGLEQARTRRMVIWGACFGVLLSLFTYLLSQTFVHSLMRYGEKLEAVVSVLAVLILFMVTNWVFHKVYWVEWNSRLRDLSKSAQTVRAPRWELLALLGVGCLTVYREGFETTIFMQSLVLEGGHDAVALGVLAGLLVVGSIGLMIFRFGVKLPYRKLLVITGFLVVSIMVTFLGSTVRLFQTVSWLAIHPIRHLTFPNWVGLWLGLYPSWEGLLIPPLALVYVGGAWLFTKITFKPHPSRPSVSTASAQRPSLVTTGSDRQEVVSRMFDRL